MMPGLDNHLVEMHRDLRCTRSRNRSWCALPMRCLCWPRAGVCRAGEGRRGRANLGVMAVWPHVCLSTMECQQLVLVGLVVSTFGASAVAAGRHHQQCQLLPEKAPQLAPHTECRLCMCMPVPVMAPHSMPHHRNSHLDPWQFPDMCSSGRGLGVGSGSSMHCDKCCAADWLGACGGQDEGPTPPRVTSPPPRG